MTVTASLSSLLHLSDHPILLYNFADCSQPILSGNTTVSSDSSGNAIFFDLSFASNGCGDLLTSGALILVRSALLSHDVLLYHPLPRISTILHFRHPGISCIPRRSLFRFPAGSLTSRLTHPRIFLLECPLLLGFIPSSQSSLSHLSTLSCIG